MKENSTGNHLKNYKEDAEKGTGFKTEKKYPHDTLQQVKIIS